MALDYDLRVSTGLNARQISELLLASVPGVEASADSQAIVAAGVTISVSPESALGRQIVKEKFGLDTSIKLNLRLDKFDRFDDGSKTVIRVSLDLLDKTRADGILLLNHDTPVLMRKAGRLMLDSGPGFWPGLPSLVGQPYSIQRLSTHE